MHRHCTHSRCYARGQATLAFGPTLLGLAHDLTGGYDAALILCIALQLSGAVVLLVAGRR
jgi:cyanate permease